MTSADMITGDEESREVRRDLRSEASSDTQAMREEIASTRMRMSDTLDEIGERLNPQTIKDNVKDSIREATIGRVNDMARNATDSIQRSTSGIANVVRDNPIPAAMIAIGLGWMFFNGGKSDDANRAPHAMASRGQDNATGVSTGIKNTASDVAASVKDKTGELADSVKERAQHLASTVAETTRRGQGRVEETYRANPLALGAVAVAAGLAVGLAAPATDRERRMLGGEMPTFM